jgi:hypothetical protein
MVKLVTAELVLLASLSLAFEAARENRQCSWLGSTTDDRRPSACSYRSVARLRRFVRDRALQ